ncbi:MAG: type IV pilus assembly protein PilM, partial [Actinobacteria bacterium]
GSGFQLTGYGRTPMPYGAVVEGEIVDPQAAGAAIASLWKQSGFRSKEVAVGVANQKVVVRLVDLPFMEKTELAGAIQYQAQDYIPIPVEEAILSYEVIGDYMTSADEHMMEVLLVAAAREMIQGTVATVDAAGLKLDRIDLTAFALVRALMGLDSEVLPDDDATGATGLIHITSGLTNIAIVERGIPRFTRVSALAGKQFTQAIANVMNLTYDEAEDLKIRVGLPSMDGLASVPPGVDAETAAVAQQALERETNRFIGEVRRSLDYYLTQATQVRTIKRIILTGSGSMLRNLPNYLEKGLQTDIILGDPLARVSIAGGVEQAAISDRMGCAPAVGLALGGVG